MRTVENFSPDLTGWNFTIYPIISNLGLFYRRINPIFFPRQRGNVSTSTIGNLQLAISFATDETFEWNFYFVLGLFITNAYRADTRLTLLQSPRAWREAERIMALSRYTYLYVTLLPALFLRPLLTSSAADCTRKWRERLDYNYTPLFLKLVSCTRARYFPSKELFSIFTRGYFTQQVIRERNCFSKCLPQCPRPRGAQRPLEILAAIFYRDLSCLNGKFFSRRVIQMAWRSLEVVGISCKALVNYCAAEYFTGNARNWRTRIFFLEKGGGGCKCSYLNNRLSGFEAFTSIFLNSTFSNFYLF